MTVKLVVILIFPWLCMPFSVAAQEHDLEYSSEHAIEGFMDARYALFPEIETDHTKAQHRFQLGISSLTSGQYQGYSPMLGWQYYLPVSIGRSFGVIVSSFVQAPQYDGDKGNHEIIPIFTSDSQFSGVIPLTVHRIKGRAIQLGFSAAITQRFNASFAWQLGAAIERFDVRELSVDFTTRMMPAGNFSGQVDYAGIYNSITPYFSIRYFLPFQFEHLRLSARYITANPGPHVGFQGAVTTNSFTLAGDSQEAGLGTHIPDNYHGLGFTIESKKSGMRCDLGATLYYWLAESSMHKGVSRPFVASCSWKL